MNQFYIFTTNFFTYIFNLYICVIFFRKFLIREKRKKFVRFLTIITIFVIYCLLDFFYSSTIVTMISFLLITFLIEFLIFEGNFITMLVLPLLYTVLGIFTECVTGLLLAKLYDVDIQQLSLNLAIQLQGQFSSKLLLFLLVMLIISKKKSQTNDIPAKYSFTLMLLPLISVFIIYQLDNIAVIDHSKITLMMILTEIGIILINVITFSLIDSILIQSEIHIKYRLAQQQLIIQLCHYENLVENRKIINAFMHDIKNHLLCIKSLAEKGNNSLIMDYINALNMNALKGLKTLDTGHPVIDAVLDEKKQLAEFSGIKMNIEVILPEKISIDNVDICTILGNSLDNSIEACNRITNLEFNKEITVNLKYNDVYYIFSISNTVEPDYNFSLQNYTTTKKEKHLHGFGLHNLENVVKKYDGNMNIFCEDGLFVLNIILYSGVKNKPD